MQKYNSITGLVIAFFVIMAAIIGYGIAFCVGMDNGASWTDNDQAFIIPIGILAGLGFFVGQDIWDKKKKVKNVSQKKPIDPIDERIAQCKKTTDEIMSGEWRRKHEEWLEQQKQNNQVEN